MGRVNLTDRGLDKMIEGFRVLSRGPSAPMRAEWDAAAERFFAATQTHVHVLSGALKTTGSHETLYREFDDSLEVHVFYGGPVPQEMRGDGMPEIVDYAIFEHERGEDHAWITNSWATVSDSFPRGLERGFVRTWR